eukprot:jgi/Botrbrau1/8305/Bobra.0251s0031.1
MQSKEEAIYGYQTDSDDEDGRRKGPKKKADYTKPVGFVSSGVTGGTAEPAEERVQNAEDAEMDFSSGGRAGLGSTAGLGSSRRLGPQAEDQEDDDADILPGAFGRRILEKARERDKLQKEKIKTEKQRNLAKAANKDVGGFEKHTKGIGEKLLRMAGWQPGQGLGRNQQGIAAPIEAKLRPKGMGMGFNDYDEHKLLPPTEDDKPKAPDMIQQKDKKGQLWKKKYASERVKREYRTADEVLKDAGESALEVPRQTIIDMRGPQARIVTNMEHLNVETTDGAAEVIPMPELQHNLRLLVDLAEADIQRLDGKLRQEKDTAVVLGREQQRMDEEVEAVQQQAEVMGAILEEMERCQSGASASTLPEKELVYRRLKAQYPQEYQLYNLADAALSQVLPHFAEIFQGWRPLQDPGRGVGELLTWRNLLEDSATRDAIFQDVGVDGDGYARLLSAVVLPKFAVAVVNEWEPRDCEPMLQWVDGWSHLLPPALLRHVLHNLVFPKVRRAVDAWEPRAETVPLHAWLHPWLPTLGDQLQDLYPGIRYKLVAALQHWDPDDVSALALLKPWSTVFEAKEWDALMGRSILPKLAWALDNRFTVNPACQDLATWHSVVAWAGVMSASMFAGLLESRFFPKWHGVLHYWLSNMPDFDEVTAWFRGWKSIIPEELQDHERIRPQLNGALDMINTASTGQIPQQYVPRPHQHAYAQATYGAGMSYGGQAAANGGPAELSLRQLIEKYAAEQNIEFMPKVGRSHNGLQVYAFGLVSVVVDSASDIIKAQLGERWAPVSLQTLVDEHQRRAAAQGSTR